MREDPDCFIEELSKVMAFTYLSCEFMQDLSV